jgi:hypothetical protein
VTGSTVGATDTLAATLNPQALTGPLVTDSGNRYAVQGSAVFQVGTGASGMAASGSATAAIMQTLATGYDQRAYGFDYYNRKVWWVKGGTGGESPTLASTGTFTLGPSGPWHLAAGPDGNFYVVDNATDAQQLSPTGALQSVTLPGGYQGGADAIFDGHDGYLYVALNANLGGTIEVDRISH